MILHRLLLNMIIEDYKDILCFTFFFQFQTNSPVINTWLETMCNGLYNPENDFKCLFQYLFPNYGAPHSNYKQMLKVAPSDPAQDGTLLDGVVLSLLYGFRDGRYRKSQPTLIPKRLGLFARSQSSSLTCSCDCDDEELEDHVLDPQCPSYEPFIEDLQDDPMEYNLKHDKLHVYFECHKPDLVLIEWREMSLPQNHAIVKDVARAKLIIEISAYNKFRGYLERHVSESVEQCVLSCLAAYAHDQTLMYGIVVVVDGLKLVKVEKIQNGGVWQYIVSETNLIMWENAAGIHSVLHVIDQQL